MIFNKNILPVILSFPESGATSELLSAIVLSTFYILLIQIMCLNDFIDKLMSL